MDYSNSRGPEAEPEEAYVDLGEPYVHQRNSHGHSRKSSSASSHSSASRSKHEKPAVIMATSAGPDDNDVQVTQVTQQQPKKDTKTKEDAKGRESSNKTWRVSTTENRDPKNIAAAIKVTFEDIIGEPDPGLYSFDGVWSASQATYAWCRLWWYRVLTLICGVPAACCCGICFACLSCCASWCWAPMLKVFQVIMAYVRLFVEAILSCCIEPCCYAYGIYWSRIRITLRHEGKFEHYDV